MIYGAFSRRTTTNDYYPLVRLQNSTSTTTTGRHSGGGTSWADIRRLHVPTRTIRTTGGHRQLNEQKQSPRNSAGHRRLKHSIIGVIHVLVCCTGYVAYHVHTCLTQRESGGTGGEDLVRVAIDLYKQYAGCCLVVALICVSLANQSAVTKLITALFDVDRDCQLHFGGQFNLDAQNGHWLSLVPQLVALVAELQFIAFTLLIKARYESLNRVLLKWFDFSSNVTERNQINDAAEKSPRCGDGAKLGPVRLKDDGESCCSKKENPFDDKHSCGGPDPWWRKEFGHHRTTAMAEMPAETDRLRQLHEVYLRLGRTTRLTNRSFGVQNLILILYQFVTLVELGYTTAMAMAQSPVPVGVMKVDDDDGGPRANSDDGLIKHLKPLYLVSKVLSLSPFRLIYGPNKGARPSVPGTVQSLAALVLYGSFHLYSNYNDDFNGSNSGAGSGGQGATLPVNGTEPNGEGGNFVSVMIDVYSRYSGLGLYWVLVAGAIGNQRILVASVATLVEVDEIFERQLGISVNNARWKRLICIQTALIAGLIGVFEWFNCLMYLSDYQPASEFCLPQCYITLITSVVGESQFVGYVKLLEMRLQLINQLLARLNELDERGAELNEAFASTTTNRRGRELGLLLRHPATSEDAVQHAWTLLSGLLWAMVCSYRVFRICNSCNSAKNE
ncbi:hypothetical protein pipiens_008513, partial [Culex pipiens pipiens]